VGRRALPPAARERRQPTREPPRLGVCRPAVAARLVDPLERTCNGVRVSTAGRAMRSVAQTDSVAALSLELAVSCLPPSLPPAVRAALAPQLVGAPGPPDPRHGACGPSRAQWPSSCGSRTGGSGWCWMALEGDLVRRMRLAEEARAAGAHSERAKEVEAREAAAAATGGLASISISGEEQEPAGGRRPAQRAAHSVGVAPSLRPWPWRPCWRRRRRS